MSLPLSLVLVGIRDGIRHKIKVCCTMPRSLAHPPPTINWVSGASAAKIVRVRRLHAFTVCTHFRPPRCRCHVTAYLNTFSPPPLLSYCQVGIGWYMVRMCGKGGEAAVCWLLADATHTVCDGCGGAVACAAATLASYLRCFTHHRILLLLLCYSMLLLLLLAYYCYSMLLLLQRLLLAMSTTNTH